MDSEKPILCSNCKKVMALQKPLKKSMKIGKPIAEHVEKVISEVLSEEPKHKLKLTEFRKYNSAKDKRNKLLIKKIALKEDSEKLKIQDQINDLEKLIQNLYIYEGKSEADIRKK